MSIVRFAWTVLGYTVVVILWGAFVRATGAGAGCGSHWPLCNGEILPRSPGTETLIEFSHRLSSGLLGILVVVLVLLVFRRHPRGHGARWAAAASLGFVVAEALIGAGLVRFEWVADNDSVARVVTMAFHLVNTFLLLAAMTLTVWFVSGGGRLRLRAASPMLILAFGVMLLVGSSGAVTALGDTLLLTEGVTREDSAVVDRLVASRFYHPLLALALAPVMFLAARAAFAPRASQGPESRRCAFWLLGFFGLQLVCGVVNVTLKAPVGVQLAHLLISDLIWITLVWLGSLELAVGGERRLAGS